jgi:hypothetical protein
MPFNIGGAPTVTSLPGFALTVLLLCIMIAYFVTRLQVLVFKLNPQITQSIVMNNFDPSYVVNTKDIGFKFAWGIETTYNPQPKFDSNYVRWVANMPVNNDDTIGHSRNLNFHRCTDEDYDSFYKPSNAYKNSF